MGARYLPTRRSIPTQLERNERLRELFQHVSAFKCDDTNKAAQNVVKNKHTDPDFA